MFATAVATFGRSTSSSTCKRVRLASLDQTTDEQLHKMLGTDLWGTIITCREALKHFGHDGGSIIDIGSMSSERFSRWLSCAYREQGLRHRCHEVRSLVRPLVALAHRPTSLDEARWVTGECIAVSGGLR